MISFAVSSQLYRAPSLGGSVGAGRCPKCLNSPPAACITASVYFCSMGLLRQIHGLESQNTSEWFQQQQFSHCAIKSYSARAVHNLPDRAYITVSSTEGREALWKRANSHNHSISHFCPSFAGWWWSEGLAGVTRGTRAVSQKPNSDFWDLVLSSGCSTKTYLSKLGWAVVSSDVSPCVCESLAFGFW